MDPQFSSDDPRTPMKRAFQAHTLMQKGGMAGPYDQLTNGLGSIIENPGVMDHSLSYNSHSQLAMVKQGSEVLCTALKTRV